MQMTWRWYGEGNDQIKLSDIKQIPGVEGIVWALHDKMPGEIWQPEEIAEVDEAVRLNLSLIVLAYKKNGGSKQAIPLLVRNVSEYLTETLNDMIE